MFISENIRGWRSRFALLERKQIEFKKKTISDIDNNSIVIVDFTDFEIRIRFCVIIDARV